MATPYWNLLEQTFFAHARGVVQSMFPDGTLHAGEIRRGRISDEISQYLLVQDGSHVAIDIIIGGASSRILDAYFGSAVDISSAERMALPSRTKMVALDLLRLLISTVGARDVNVFVRETYSPSNSGPDFDPGVRALTRATSAAAAWHYLNEFVTASDLNHIEPAIVTRRVGNFGHFTGHVAALTHMLRGIAEIRRDFAHEPDVEVAFGKDLVRLVTLGGGEAAYDALVQDLVAKVFQCKGTPAGRVRMDTCASISSTIVTHLAAIDNATNNRAARLGSSNPDEVQRALTELSRIGRTNGRETANHIQAVFNGLSFPENVVS